MAVGKSLEIKRRRDDGEFVDSPPELVAEPVAPSGEVVTHAELPVAGTRCCGLSIVSMAPRLHGGDST
jgi:hypothetical protein